MVRVSQAVEKRQFAAVRYTGRTQKYAAFLMISRAVHLNVFEQPV